jgi:natural product biosynthesis luciferase-like monooxygenase protein
MTISTVVIGNESLLIGCCEALLARGHDIRAVVSTDAEITSWAVSKGLKTHSRPAEIDVEFDWLLSIANLQVLPEAVISKARLGAVNFHDGPLPDRAGLNTPNWAILEGAEEHGITWHLIEGGVDEGDILAQRRFAIAPDETAFSLNSKCYGAALDSFGEVLEQLESGALERTPQDLSHRRYHARKDRPDAAGFLRFDRNRDTLLCLVRGLDMGGYWNPLTTAKIRLPEQVAAVGATQATEGEGIPGEVLAVSANALTVACADGAIELRDLKTLSGGALQPSALLEVGDVLPTLSDQEVEALNAAAQTCQKAEPYWRRSLAEMLPLPVPLQGAELDVEATADIQLPTDCAPQTLMAAVLAWLLQSLGETAGSIALSLPDLQTSDDLGVLSNWVPLSAEIDEKIKTVEARAAEVLDRLDNMGGFATDLILRAPEVTIETPPEVALCLGTDLAPAQAKLALIQSDSRLQLRSCQLSPEALSMLAARLQCLLNTLPEDGAATLSTLPMLPDSERTRLIETWNDTGCDYPTDQTIHAAFEAQVARTPDAIAVVFEDQQLTYRALNQRADALARHLHDLGAKPGSHVGVYLRRSMDLVIATLGILKAGAAYVPLDPTYPADRIAHYITDSQAAVIVTHESLAAELPESDARQLHLDALDLTTEADPIRAGAAEDLAYLIYTSGSTGLPKGVMVRHRNVANFFTAMDARIPHQPGDAWLAVTSLSFDISVLELFWTLARGFKLVLSSDESRLQLANGPIGLSDRKMDFNLYYWGNDDGAGEKKYELLLEGAKFADAHGFNAVWTPERHFHAFGGPYPNPSVTGAAVAAVTRNIGVRAGSCVAPLHHPARIAEEWAVIDNLTGGRAGIGFASGWQPDDFILRPENTPPANKPALFEALQTVRKLWRGEEVAFPRADGGQHSVVTQPRPVSEELAVWVTTAGNPETWREAGRVGANVLTHLLGQSIDEVGDKIALYHAALREAGYDPADFTVTLMLHTYLAETREAAREVAREPMKDYLRSAAGLIKQYAWAFPAFKRPKGVDNPFEMDLGSLSSEELEAILDFAFERYFEESGLFGTVDDAVARVEDLKRIGVDEVACLIDYGIAPHVVLEGLKPLAEVLRRSNRVQELANDDFSLAAQIVRHGVTHMQCTPSMARMIASDADASPALGRLRHLLVGGEALPGDLVAALREQTRATLHNMYGPTETTIWSTVETLERAPTGIAPIGTPVANTSVYVLDAKGQLAPVGAAGELYIGGAGVTAGYWRRDALTAERFPDDPFLSGQKMYRTGDLVRWREDGRLDFLGRTDHQVKIRGQRIELGEIETALAAVEGVTAAVVIPRKIGSDERLVGYVTASGAFSETEAKAQLSRQLAGAMVPSHIVVLEAFPLTPNKKIDRKALPDPTPSRQEAHVISAEPHSPVQQKIAEIWKALLGVPAVGRSDNFFALGGHSLLAVQAHRDIRSALEVERLSITDIFRFPTLDGLASHLEHLQSGDTPVAETSPAAPAGRADTMSKRRAMRANRKARSG